MNPGGGGWYRDPECSKWRFFFVPFPFRWHGPATISTVLQLPSIQFQVSNTTAPIIATWDFLFSPHHHRHHRRSRPFLAQHPRIDAIASLLRGYGGDYKLGTINPKIRLLGCLLEDR